MISDTNQVITIFKLLEKPLEFFVKNLFDGAEELKKLQNAGKMYGLSLTFSPTMARGLGYYTGNIFEIKVKDTKESVAGGGRYDKLVGKYLHREIPAVGISFGLERMSSLVKDENLQVMKTKCLLISIRQDKETVRLVQNLRKQEISCITMFGQPSSALDYANSLKIPYVIFVGENEVKAEKYKLKDMSSGEEKLLSEKQLINKLKK